MGSIRIRRRAVALVAAYAVAMQALLLAFALPPVARAEAVLCSASHGGDPVQHAPDCATMCAALAATVAGPLPPAAVVGLAEPQSGEGLTAPSQGPLQLASILGSHAPRGPPHG